MRSGDSTIVQTVLATKDRMLVVPAMLGALLLLVLHLGAWPQEIDEERTRSAHELLESIRAMRSERSPVTMSIETIWNRSFSDDPSSEVTTKILTEFVTDQNRYKSIERRYDVKNGQEILERQSANLFDGKEFQSLYHMVHEKGDLDTMVVDLDGSSAVNHSSFSPVESFLKDILPGEGIPIYEILAASTNAYVHDTRENVQEFPCIVLEGDSEYGHHKVWIDPENGYHFRRVEVTKSAGDFLFESRIASKTGEVHSAADSDVMFFYLLDDVEIGLFNGEYYRTGSRVSIVKYLSGDDVMIDTLEFKCSDIIVDPVLDDSEAFSLAIPEGTTIFIEDFPDLKYIYRDGKRSTLSDSTFYDIEQSLNNMLEPPISPTIGKPSPVDPMPSVRIGETGGPKVSQRTTTVFAVLAVTCMVATAAAFLLFRLGTRHRGQPGRVDDNANSK